MKLHVIGLLHPAGILRGAWAKEPAQVEYLRRAKAIADGATPDLLDPTVPAPHTILTPTLAELEEWLGGVTADGVAVDCEYETGRVDMIAFTRINDLHTVVVDLLATDRGPMWYQEAVAWSKKVFEHPLIPIVFQNGISADIPALSKIGIEVEGYAFDTMLAAHIMYSEMPKRLQFLGIFWENLPAWKYLMHGIEEAEEEIK